MARLTKKMLARIKAARKQATAMAGVFPLNGPTGNGKTAQALTDLPIPQPPPRGFFTQLPSTELVASLHGALLQTINYGVKPSDLDLLRDECVRRGLL
jgi:hypothetical protein